MKEVKTISREKVMEVFRISSGTTIRYEKNGILRRIGKYSFRDTTFDYEHICDLLGLKQIPDEPLLTTEEAVELLDLPKSIKRSIRPYCKRHKIPYYAFDNAKGTVTYFLRSEIEAAKEYKIKWGTEFPDYITRNSTLQEIFKIATSPVFCESLNPKERNIVEDIFLHKLNMERSSKKNGMEYGHTNGCFNSGIKKILYAMRTLEVDATRITELSKQNANLLVQNKLLLDRLKVLEDAKIISNQKNVNALATPFNTMRLDTRTFNAIKKLEVNNLYELSKLRRSDVEKYQSIGSITIDSLEYLLKKNNLTWKPELVLTIKNYRGEKRKNVKTILPSVEEKLRK